MSSFSRLSMKNMVDTFFTQRNNPVIHNRYILYVFVFLSLSDLVILSSENDISSILMFFIIGFITSQFSKNMLIVLFIALTITNIFKYGTNIIPHSENMLTMNANELQDKKIEYVRNVPSSTTPISTNKTKK